MKNNTVPKPNDYEPANETATKAVAQRVVSLICAGDQQSVGLARHILDRAYSGAPVVARRAYDLALSIALKRIEARAADLAAEAAINPEADSLALKASQLILTGDIRGAFHPLKEAVTMGVRRQLGRSVSKRQNEERPHETFAR